MAWKSVFSQLNVLHRRSGGVTTAPRRRRPPAAVRRRVGALATAGVLLAGCAHSEGAAKGPATILANWFPQAELGGYWQAKDVKMIPGGPGIQTIPQVASGKAMFGIATGADDLLVARKQGLPIVAVFAPFRANITCLVAHTEAGVRTFADLNGKRVARISSRPWWEYLKRHYHLDRAQEVNYTGSLAMFKKDPSMVQQCYLTSEPYYLKRDHVRFTTLSLSDQGGYQAYSNVLFTTENMVKQHPDLVRSVVARAAAGWKAFLADPSAGRQAILAANKDAEPGVIDYAVRTMRAGNWVTAGPMSDGQWRKIRDQVAEAGLVPSGMDYTKAFTTKFLP